MKTNIDRRSVVTRFKPTAKVAKTVNGADSGMKHLNILKRKIQAKCAHLNIHLHKKTNR